MDLFRSTDLKELPDLSEAGKLEILRVTNCWNLEELPPSILELHELKQLEMDFCLKLKTVPTLLNLASLHRVWMWGCWQLKNIPDISTNITDLSIAETMLEDVPDSIRLCDLKIIRIGGSMGFGGHIEKLPDWIKDLHKLEELYIGGCPKLASLPQLPASLSTLRVDNCESLETIISMETFQFWNPHFPSFLYFSNCFKLDLIARRVITNKSVKAYLPGGTIPENFNQRASGNSLTIRSDFNLFEICVVVSPNQPLDECSLLCDIRINGCPNERKISYDISKIDKEHLYMSYVDVSDKDEGWREQDNEILFEFRTTSTELKITQCGVLDRQAHNPKSSYKFTSKEFSEDDDEDSLMGAINLDDDEDSLMGAINLDDDMQLLSRVFGSEAMRNMSGASSGSSTGRLRGRVTGLLKLDNDNNVFKGVDEVLINEVETLQMKNARLEEELKDIATERTDFEKFQMKLEKRFERVEYVLEESLSRMKKMMIFVVIIGCLITVGVVKQIG